MTEEVPFRAGFETRLVASLTSSPDALPFQPVATRQGVVMSMSDAEWLLVRTEGRLRELERRGDEAMALPADLSDRRALSEALADACGLTPPEVLRRLTLWITARAKTIEHGVADAAAMGHEHGLSGVKPYCRLDEDGHDDRLMHAFGETEPTTDANARHRLALIQSYTAAYSRARKGIGSAPAELAARDFPYEPGESVSSADAPPAAQRPEAELGTQSRHLRKMP